MQAMDLGTMIYLPKSLKSGKFSSKCDYYQNLWYVTKVLDLDQLNRTYYLFKNQK